jgi:hypothetical protein
VTNVRVFFAVSLCVACSSPAKPVVQEAKRVPATVADVSPAVAPTATMPAQSLVTASCANALPEADEAHPLVPPVPVGGGSVMRSHFDGGFGFYRVNGLGQAPRTTGDLPFELRLAAPATASTTSPIALSLDFTNTSHAPLAVLRPLDGSTEHMRDPTVDLYLRDETSGDVYVWAFHGGRCGNMNFITKDDFTAINPNQSKSDVHKNGWAPHLEQVTIGRAGTYSLWVVYEVCGHGLGLRQADVHFTASAGAHASNAVRIVVQ